MLRLALLGLASPALAPATSIDGPIRCTSAASVPDSVWSAIGVSGLLSVKLLGAAGDGTTDDSDAVQRAIQCVALTGGVVWFPPGEFFFNKTVNLLEDPAPLFGNQARAPPPFPNPIAHALVQV